MNSSAVNTEASARILGLTEYTVLGTLSLGEAHGYDVFKFLNDNLSDICRFGRSQTYAVLSRLEQEGLVFHDKVYQENLPAKKVFRLTPAGQEIFDAWMTSPVAHIRDLRVEFLVKLFFTGLKPTGVREQFVADQMETCRKKAKNLEETKVAVQTPIQMLALDYRIAIVNSTIEWLRGLL